MTLQEAYDEFIFSKRAQGLTDKTIDSYHNMLHIFVDYFGSDRNTDSLTFKDIQQFSIDLRSRSLSKASVSTYMRNAKIFLRWISDEYGLSFEAKKIKVPKAPKKKAHIYSDEEIQQIFDSIKSPVPWITARNCAMVALMLDCGIRQCELCGLQRSDVDFFSKCMKVYGKGDKERFVPIGSLALDLLSRYYTLCPYQTATVFTNKDGSLLSHNAVKLFTYRLQKKLGFKFSSHGLRHNFATHYILDNLEERHTSGVYDLSILMGHESIETTKRYEHIAHELIAVKSCNSHLDKVYKHT